MRQKNQRDSVKVAIGVNVSATLSFPGTGRPSEEEAAIMNRLEEDFWRWIHQTAHNEERKTTHKKALNRSANKR